MYRGLLPFSREVELDPRKHARLDHGYAVTSHSSQGQTADRVLIHVDTELGAKDLLNNRMAYVAISRGAYDAQLFTNDSEKLGVALGRDVSHRSALAPEVQPQEEIAPKTGDRAQPRLENWFVAPTCPGSWERSLCSLSVQAAAADAVPSAALTDKLDRPKAAGYSGQVGADKQYRSSF